MTPRTARTYVLSVHPQRRPSQEYLAAITVANDELPLVREAKEHTKEKLGILQAYLPAYATACQRAGRWYFIDPLAGPGLYHFARDNRYVLGSTPIALRVEPFFAACLAMDNSEECVDALRARTQIYGERAIVVRGDCNTELSRALDEHIPRRFPKFVLLDPEGVELEWATVALCAAHTSTPRKPELLILFATSGVNRIFPHEGNMPLRLQSRLNELFPPGADWRTPWRARQSGDISPTAARDAYLQLYANGLRDLHYVHVQSREIRRPTGALVYHLLFATDHDVGDRIMSHVFETVFPNRAQMELL